MCFFSTENKENKESSRIRVSDLIKLPKFDPSTQKAKRKAPASAPSYHLTSRKSLKFIEEADARQKEKDKKEKELDKIKKEAVKQAKQAKAKEKKKKRSQIQEEKLFLCTQDCKKSSKNFPLKQEFYLKLLLSKKGCDFLNVTVTRLVVLCKYYKRFLPGCK